MITINSYLHRGALQYLIRRWMYNQAEPSDADTITRLVHFNQAFVSRYLKVFSEHLFGRLHDGPLQGISIRCKADFKDALVAHCPVRNPRIEQMLYDYRDEPGRFFRETPFHGRLYLGQGPHGPVMVGASRIKRFRRLGEKIARRIIDHVFASIKDSAEMLARERAIASGVPVDALITSEPQMIEEFLGAERRLLHDLRSNRPILADKRMVIQDVAGIKVIVADDCRGPLLEKIARLERCELIEIEEHKGRYNAVNLVVRYTPDREALVAEPPSASMLELMRVRGMDPGRVHEQFKQFVLTAEQDVHLEVILCNYQEMLESELGRCMHEDRILRQRVTQQYNGQLANNIEFLIAYLFAFAASSRTELEALPIRLWDRYLPDYFDEVLMELFDVPRLELME
jgi:hypothetical protein